MQVTHGSSYAHVSQADDGTMIALAPGERLHRLSRSGQVLADLAIVVPDGAPQAGPVNRFHGPFEPAISPDNEVAPGCRSQPVPPCTVHRQSQDVAASRRGAARGSRRRAVPASSLASAARAAAAACFASPARGHGWMRALCSPNRLRARCDRDGSKDRAGLLTSPSQLWLVDRGPERNLGITPMPLAVGSRYVGVRPGCR